MLGGRKRYLNIKSALFSWIVVKCAIFLLEHQPRLLLSRWPCVQNVIVSGCFVKCLFWLRRTFNSSILYLAECSIWSVESIPYTSNISSCFECKYLTLPKRFRTYFFFLRIKRIWFDISHFHHIFGEMKRTYFSFCWRVGK